MKDLYSVLTIHKYIIHLHQVKYQLYLINWQNIRKRFSEFFRDSCCRAAEHKPASTEFVLWFTACWSDTVKHWEYDFQVKELFD